MIKLNEVNTKKQQHIGCRGRTLGDPQNAITIISLVITIVILVILAGVAINLTVGENGLLRKAKLAKQEYNNAVASEEEQLNELYAYLNAEDLPENTKENPQPLGTPVKLPSKWETTTPNYVSLSDGSVVTKSTKVASVYAVSVGNGNTVPIPVGFWYVGGTLDTGVVISDKKEDSFETNKRDMTSHADAINLIGDQFVWIPCEAEEYVKSNWSSDGSQGNITGRSNCYWSTIPDDKGSMQIEKYEGFYVSRYEAGLPKDTIEFEKSVSSSSNIYNSIEGVPQSKAGVSPWNFIDWNNSKLKAKKMYEGKTNIASGLITGTQWDVMITKIGSLKDENKNFKYSLTDSASWGNYYSGYSTTDAFTFRGKVSQYSSSNQYAFKEPDSTTKKNSTYFLLQTGASEHNLAYNLYDVAGNLWEWTEESAAYYNSIGTLTTNRVLRGGRFSDPSSVCPASFRDGGCDDTFTHYDVGFRVVLYMN